MQCVSIHVSSGVEKSFIIQCKERRLGVILCALTWTHRRVAHASVQHRTPMLQFFLDIFLNITQYILKTEMYVIRILCQKATAYPTEPPSRSSGDLRCCNSLFLKNLSIHQVLPRFEGILELGRKHFYKCPFYDSFKLRLFLV